MKATEFSPGDYCRFPNSEIPAMLDLLRENGHLISDRKIDKDEDNAVYFSGHSWGPAWLDGHYASMHKDTELTREQFMYKATRGNGATVSDLEIVQFDPSKPFEVSDDAVEWRSVKETDYFMHYIGLDREGQHVIEGNLGFVRWAYVRNIDPEFTAAMLEVGEYMLIEEDRSGVLGKKHLMVLDTGKIACIETGDTFDKEDCHVFKGRRVDVELIVKEV